MVYWLKTQVVVPNHFDNGVLVVTVGLRQILYGVLCKPAPIRGVGSLSRTRYTPSMFSILCAAHERATNALAIVASSK